MSVAGGSIASKDGPEQPAPALNDVGRDHPRCRNDVCVLPAVPAQRRGSAERARSEIGHEAVRFWWNRFGPMFAAEIRKRRVSGMRSSSWHLDEVFVKINGELH